MAEQGEDEEEGRKLFVVFEAMINRSQIDRWKRRERERGGGSKKGERNQSQLPSSIGFLPPPPLSLLLAAPFFVPPTELYP